MHPSKHPHEYLNIDWDNANQFSYIITVHVISFAHAWTSLSSKRNTFSFLFVFSIYYLFVHFLFFFLFGRAIAMGLASLVCDVDQLLNVRVSALHSRVTGSTSTGGDRSCWELIRSKPLSSVSVCHAQCLLNFLVMVIQFILFIYALSMSSEGVDNYHTGNLSNYFYF